MRQPSPARRLYLERAAARMREYPTPPELTLWNRLKNRQFRGLWFTNQEVMGTFILDFYCEEKRIAIEVDGGNHLHKKHQRSDPRRDFELEKSGIRVIRINSQAVKKDLPFTLERIALAAGLMPLSTVSTGNTEKKETPKRLLKMKGCASCGGTGWILSDYTKARRCIHA